MALAHPNPGICRRRLLRHNGNNARIASAPPDIIRLRQILRPLHSEKLSEIKNSAKEVWQSDSVHARYCSTTYGSLHGPKYLDEPTNNRVRPTSPQRVNKPHPPNVFLVTRLKKVSGCYEPDTAAKRKYGSDARENLDDYVSDHRKEIALAMGKTLTKAPHRPHTSDERINIQTLVGQVPAQAAEAWIKLSNDKEKTSIRKMFNETDRIKSQLDANKQSSKTIIAAKRPPQPPSLRARVPVPREIYSTTRWLKKAGYTENGSVTKLFESLRRAPSKRVPMEGPHFHVTDYSPMFSNAPMIPYHDFQIHPEWHQPWHKKYETATKA